jgi:hypothetical protein
MHPAGRGAQGNQVAIRPGSASAGRPIRRPYLPHHPRTWESRGQHLGGVAAIGNGWCQWTKDVRTILRNTGYGGEVRWGSHHPMHISELFGGKDTIECSLPATNHQNTSHVSLFHCTIKEMTRSLMSVMVAIHPIWLLWSAKL